MYASLFGAKNIERVGDHTTNIAENVYYLVHGTTLTDDRPKVMIPVQPSSARTSR
jgi:phosphate uptake regulator